LVLWDIENQHSLASYRIAGDLDTAPRWSLDGKQFAFAPNLFQKMKWPVYEVLVVDRNGNTIQETHLTDYFPWVYIDDLSWSPDGQRIAFWFSTFREQPGLSTHGSLFLAVFDVTSGIVTNYCVPGDNDAQLGGRRKSIPPIWSPDGKQLIVQSRYSEEHSRVILVDLAIGRAYQIAEDMDPVGWMVSP
jgi:Tol biopolymer transport system component